MKKPTKKQVKDAANKVAKKTNEAMKNPLFIKVVGLSAGAYILYRVVNKMLTAPKPDKVNDIPIVVVPDATVTTISVEQAGIYAQTLLEAMDKQPYGTYVDRILGVFKQINADDFKLIFNAFGQKNYNGGGSPPESWFWQQFDNYSKRNLVFWLKSELNSWLDAETYDLVKKIVKQAGFVF